MTTTFLRRFHLLDHTPCNHSTFRSLRIMTTTPTMVSREFHSVFYDNIVFCPIVLGVCSMYDFFGDIVFIIQRWRLLQKVSIHRGDTSFPHTPLPWRGSESNHLFYKVSICFIGSYSLQSQHLSVSSHNDHYPHNGIPRVPLCVL